MAHGKGLSRDSARNLAEAGARLVEFGAVRMAGKSVASSGSAGIGESRDAAAALANGPPPLPTDGKIGAEDQQGVGAEDQQGVGVDISGYVGP